MGIYGFLGGDEDLYHGVGRYLSSLYLGLGDVSAIFDQEIVPLMNADNGVWFIKQINSLPLHWMGIVWLHAILYKILDCPLIFPVFNSLLSAWAVSWTIKRFGITGKYRYLLIYNPFSMVLAGTHSKESITESMTLFFAGNLFCRGRYLFSIFPLLGIFWVRISALPIFFMMYALKVSRIYKVDTRFLLFGLILLFAFMPPSFGQINPLHLDPGPFYSFIYWNSFTRQVAGPLMAQFFPIPFFPFSGIRFIFNTVYAIFYWWILIKVIRLFLTRKYIANEYFLAFFILKLCAAYYWLSGYWYVARTSGAFLCLLVLGLYVEKEKIARLRKHRIIQPQNGPLVALS